MNENKVHRIQNLPGACFNPHPTKELDESYLLMNFQRGHRSFNPHPVVMLDE